MKILITGGNGFLARNLKRLLTNKGYNVHSPSRIELDLMNRDQTAEYLRYGHFDAVIHTAINGGKKNVEDTFENTYVPNILMYENLIGCLNWKKTPVIIFGSGAEFDRRNPIRDEYASSIHFKWPIDPYGLSKNIISRRAIDYAANAWILRLFGCFNYDEDTTRFIKSCITNVNNNEPILITKNRIMDFFFLDDIIPVIEKIFEDVINPQWEDHIKLPKNINLTYEQKHGLVGIAQMITSMMNKPDHEILVGNEGSEYEYTGSGSILARSGIQLCGLREGIRRTISNLS